MKLEHLIQAYHYNKIPAKIENLINEKAGVIQYYNGVTASYLLDEENIVIAINLFFNCLARNVKKLDDQLEYTTNILNVIQQTILLLTNISKKECSLILEKIGLFDSTFRQGKKIKHLNYEYKIGAIDGILYLSINES